MDNRDSIIGALDDGNGNYIAQKIPFPNIFEGSAIIDIKASGICGSDLHMTNERNEPQSIPSGHETAGEIIELPKSYSGNLNIGDRVAIDSIGAGKACGSCYFCHYLGGGSTGKTNLLGCLTFFDGFGLREVAHCIRVGIPCKTAIFSRP